MKSNESRPAVHPALQPDRFERRAHAIIATMADAGPVPGADRREQNRRRFLEQVRIQPIDHGRAGEASLTLFARDLTGEGVGFIACGQLPIDSRTLMQIPGPAGQPISAEGQVVRIHAFASGWHEGFVRFDRPIDLLSNPAVRKS